MNFLEFLLYVWYSFSHGNASTASVVTRFVKNTYTEESKPTIGVEFATRTILIDNVRVRIQIWDTGSLLGQLTASLLFFRLPRSSCPKLVPVAQISRIYREFLNQYIISFQLVKSDFAV